MNTAIAPAPAPQTTGTEISTQLAPLPVILSQNESLAMKAEAAARPLIDSIKIIDVTTLEPGALVAHDKSLNDMSVKLVDSVTLNETRRKPLTQLFDSIRSKFTSSEKRIAALADECKAQRVRIASEINRRQEIERQKQAKTQASITLKQFISDRINQAFIAFLSSTLVRMREAYNNCPDAYKMREYVTNLQAFEPVLQSLPLYSVEGFLSIPDVYLLTQEERQAVAKTAEAELFPLISSSYTQGLKAEIEKIVLEAPLRDFSVIPPEPAADAIAETVETQAAQLNDHVETQAIADTFTTVAEMAPTVSQASGTKKKQKYIPTTHKAFIALIQWWITKKMHLATVEDLTKKFGFVITAANDALNTGERIEAEGLQIVDDINTRIKR